MDSLIIGAGKLGKRFYHYLKKNQKSVVTLSRSKKKWSTHHIQYDLLGSSEILSKLIKFSTINTVFIVLAPTNRNPQDYRNIYIEGLENILLQLAEQYPEAHYTLLSSTSVYGKQQCGLLDEKVQPEPDNFRGEILLEAEQNFKKLCNNFSIVRASGLYSKERTRFVMSLLAKEKAEDPKWLNMIHEDDLCQWLEAAANNQWPLSIASDGEPLQRSRLHSLEIDMTNYREFKSQYLHQLSLKHSSFADWLKCQ
ncbi:sugar nucleotide-binding protein [Kangiella sp. HZ709]|uniref:sugar nucleotide-binding protein n=1 Tax=Kangiella sp. HZ709 TaxID=2666328 RepID=UPI0018A2346C|nr:sugar nucleotide-binding protein [Kangiella sp. HZ709]